MSRALLLQLARLGDLIQSLPAITSLHSHFPDRPLDLLCAAPLGPVARLFPGIQRIYPWEGERWHAFSKMPSHDGQQQVNAAAQYLTDLSFPHYALAYNLNNHPRSIFAGHLLSERVVGAGVYGPLNPRRPGWVEYLRQVAQERGTNRIHLADAFCGVCGVRPPELVPTLQARHIELSTDLSPIVNDSSLLRIGIVLGAGDVDRRVPLVIWRRLLEACVECFPNCLCLLIGGAGEREAALALENQLSPPYVSRMLNCVGRTTLPQLAHVLNRCQWVVGSDTGPLHLAVSCGARVIGWYFSRARVHETGPYGVGHYVWQHQERKTLRDRDSDALSQEQGLPTSWPVMETIRTMWDENSEENLSEWDRWTSHRDEWGMWYTQNGQQDQAISQRKEMWKRLLDSSFNEHEGLIPYGTLAGQSV